MIFPVKITLSARIDTLEATEYYENIRSGLGEDFLTELEKIYFAISDNPFAFSYIDNKLVLRDVVLNRFPYVVIYRIDVDTVVILAVHNTYKKPLSL